MWEADGGVHLTSEELRGEEDDLEPQAADLLRFWFGEAEDDLAVNREKSDLWWGHAEETDQEIRTRFSQLHEKAAAGDLDGWTQSARGTLALILALDQLPRNLFRGSGRSFDTDPRALELTLAGIEAGVDRELRPIERLFFYLPLEHSESLEMQRRSMSAFRQLAAEVPGSMRETFEGFVDFARRHHEIVERFGRFPHRNSLLGRESTEEEVAFLEQPGSSF